jgi:hypothetical protein
MSVRRVTFEPECEDFVLSRCRNKRDFSHQLNRIIREEMEREWI